MYADPPERVRVKISSEAAGEISMTQVIAQEIPLRDLVDIIVGQCGKDAPRVRELLRRGTVVQSASRFRWEPVEVDLESVESMLRGYPDPDPKVGFEPSRCIRVRLCDPRSKIDLPQELVSGRRLFKRRSFWDVLMAEAIAAGPAYAGYSYRERADLFHIEASQELRRRIHEAATLIRYSGIRDQVQRAEFSLLELVAVRPKVNS